ncbi:hypothetical protein [Arthrobacter sp. B2a2-09]|uniref:hypothetical protein n=1 Tax=Arthrobacter sp. B2a2-09 TaxID=2952822 RepID=UPI0022CD31C2|nr:hypothetical protein [Arthrobacter sp. B2a2-09]MCZ9882005.1 hypothetical protein [Arthrobacter sp. B2a2-09]
MPAQSGSIRGRSATGRYSYRAKSQAQPLAAAKGEHAKLIRAFAAHRQLLSHASSAIRTLTAARNELIAQALEDALPLATVSAVTGENIRAIRTIGLAHDDLHPSGLPRGAHVDSLRAKSEELRAAERHRDQITEQREALIVMAHRTQACDDLELASLTGLTPDHIRRSTRGTARSA